LSGRPESDRGAEALPGPLAEAAAEQPAVRTALAAALLHGPSHAYVFVGPTGSGKAAVARALAATLLGLGADDPADASRRALLDPSPHPDLTWLRPPGNQHLVEDVRVEVIGAISYRPFEGTRRVFVIEAADAMAEESQNALLKTLEEPPGYAHLILISAEPAALLDTVLSRCTAVRFAPLPPESLRRRLAAELPGRPDEELEALALLAGGDLGRARLLGSPTGQRLRADSERSARAALSGRLAERPWAELIKLAAENGKQRASAVSEAAAERAAEFGKGRDATRARREGEDAAKRADRRARTEAIDLSLGLVASWFADLAAVAEGAPETISNLDRRGELEADARGADPFGARRSAELALDTRRRLRVNVNEDLALDALFHRASGLLPRTDAVV
jgi:DNA polymerase III subunit delta'